MDPNQEGDLVQEISKLLDLPISREHLPGVATNFAQLAAIAASLQAYPLDQELGAAPVFEP